ncbi:NAD(P)HX dehydratase [Alkalibacterium sp. AK22]|uniref:NAD(P)H-hydrate dehydratase n=1 Tax=Alkalibacterium sp. AK22 TaxID=1229520 RepID=UPI000452A587|nr:NAD(P)H-hydrate dehydratase [Alkalibacterium sp. AK22]EXJ23087.1 NAD(P)HX dehydratase [Alkalibacterium sp. AK22]
MDKITREKVEGFIPKRKKESYKGTYGRVLFVGGNQQMGGAIILSASAGVYSGAGLVTVATDLSNQSALHARLPEAMFLSMHDLKKLKETVDTMDVIVVGPGLGRDERSLEVLKAVYASVEEDQILLLDGDAIYLHVNEDLPKPQAQLVFTPHLGEWRTLTGLSIDEQYLETNHAKARELEAIVVLKKSRTEVYYGDEIWQNTAGNPAMATGGMGDTLAGMTAGFLAQFSNQKHAVLSAVFLHSYIADELARNQYVTLPTDIIRQIPFTMKEFTRRSSRLSFI